MYRYNYTYIYISNAIITYNLIAFTPPDFVMKPKRSALEIDVSVGRWPPLFPPDLSMYVRSYLDTVT